MSTEKRIFYSICLISFVGPFLSTSINIAIPVMAGQFGVTPDRMSWVVTIFLMTTAAFLLPLGKVSDVHGRRRTYSLSLVVFAMATAAAAFAQTLTGLIVLRAIQGIALSGVYVSYMPLLLATTDKAHQGHILGRAVSLTYLGLSLGPVIGGALTQFVGWRCIFLLSALAIVLSYAFIRPIKEEWYANGAPFVNLVSTALSVSGILCALYGLSSFEDYSAFFWAGLVLLAAFVIHEGKSFHPLLPLYLFRNLTFSMSNQAVHKTLNTVCVHGQTLLPVPNLRFQLMILDNGTGKYLGKQRDVQRQTEYISLGGILPAEGISQVRDGLEGVK